MELNVEQHVRYVKLEMLLFTSLKRMGRQLQPGRAPVGGLAYQLRKWSMGQGHSHQRIGLTEQHCLAAGMFTKLVRVLIS